MILQWLLLPLVLLQAGPGMGPSLARTKAQLTRLRTSVPQWQQTRASGIRAKAPQPKAMHMPQTTFQARSTPSFMSEQRSAFGKKRGSGVATMDISKSLRPVETYVAESAGMAPSGGGKNKFMDLFNNNPTVELVVLSAMAIFLTTLNNLLIEAMFTGTGKINATLWNFLMWSMYAVCAGIERLVYRIKGVKGSVWDYAQLATLTTVGNQMTYLALNYVSYTIRVLFKAAKIIPVMVISALYVGRKYTPSDYFNVLLLVASIVMFSYGDATGLTGATQFDMRGIGLLSLGVIADAFTSNFEEKKLFKEKNASSNEVMLITSIFSTIYVLGTMLVQGSIGSNFAFLAARPDVIYKSLLACSASYVGLSINLRIIKKFGAVTSETTKALRRLVVVFASIIRFNKPFELFHQIGSLFFVGYLGGSFKTKIDKDKAKAAKLAASEQ